MDAALGEHRLEDLLAEAASINPAGLDSACHRVVRSKMGELVIFFADEPVARQVGARNEVAGCGGIVAEAHGLSLDIGDALHRAVGARDDHALVSGRTLRHAYREWLDARRF